MMIAFIIINFKIDLKLDVMFNEFIFSISPFTVSKFKPISVHLFYDHTKETVTSDCRNFIFDRIYLLFIGKQLSDIHACRIAK